MLVSENEIPPSALATSRGELLEWLHGLRGPKSVTTRPPSSDHLPTDVLNMDDLI